MLQLGGQELDSIGQPSGGQDFLMDARDDFLRGQIGGQALAQHAKEIDLLEVLFAVQDGTRGHDSIIAFWRASRRLFPWVGEWCVVSGEDGPPFLKLC